MEQSREQYAEAKEVYHKKEKRLFGWLDAGVRSVPILSLVVVLLFLPVYFIWKVIRPSSK